MARLAVSLLGSLDIKLDDQPVTQLAKGKARALLAYLAVEADRPHRRETLAALLWPDWLERSARTNLRNALSNLRTAIGDREVTPPYLLITRETIQFNPASDCWVDVTAFSESAKEGAPTGHGLENAIALYRGPFLEGFSGGDSPAFDDWTLGVREQLAYRYSVALQALAKQYEQRGEYERACEVARQRVAQAPWQEQAHCDLMRLLALNGQRGAALAQFEACCLALREELDVKPGDETRRLYESIRSGELARSQVDPDKAPEQPKQPPLYERIQAGELDLPMAPTQLVRGYELQERVGAGGFGEVYRAYQPSVGRQVAIKIILPQYASHPEFIRRFEAEARLVARLEHPHIVPLYDYWRDTVTGGAYVVMRWLQGGNL